MRSAPDSPGPQCRKVRVRPQASAPGTRVPTTHHELDRDRDVRRDEVGVKMRLPWTQSVASTSVSGRPRDRRGFARTGLMMAWLMFWLNSALFPCCEVVAAVLGGHAGEGAPITAVALPLHIADATHSEPSDHSPDSPCGEVVFAGVPLASQQVGMTADRPAPEWVAIDTSVVAGSPAADRTTSPALDRDAPPPPLRLYLRTQRLLI